MNVALFGPCGRTGRRVLSELLDGGHEVTALTRSPSDLPDRSRLRTVRGDVRDAALVREAVRGNQAVVSALDDSQAESDGVSVLSTGTANVVDGMRATAVGRLVVVAGAEILQSTPDALRIDDPYARSFHPELADEYRAIYHTLRQSGLAWTAVCVPSVTDEDARGGYRTAVETLPADGARISTGDLAAFVADILDDGYVGKRVGISY
ncbi:NAD(P)-dependent oxidoreductase [Halegenticoccus soli]|uniref:NAD(P)-dependent oxidoreductase n=1 Tax=Halegenticoccus soli TaxID=1985678 RepID=UPI000C6DD358|nr:NAD(P)H-binding protein [Halegenticoccus soli]